ncbi:MAG: alpha/beta hydrolase [Lachnospiraceae bacterium]|nr:alpha/beta hydrolase [Lachnospiraceae bacterium]
MKTDVNGISTYYEEYGPADAPAVLVLPGWMAKASLYRIISDTISEKYHVILLDMPGFTGDTPEPPTAWDLNGFVDFTLSFIKKMNLSSLTLIGHSFGGRIIIKMMNLSDLSFSVDRIILIDAAGIRHELSDSAKRRQKMFKFAKHFMSEKQIERYKETHGSADYRAASPLMRECMVKAINEDLTPLLSGVKPEVLLIWGTADTATPISDAELMEQQMPDAGLARIEGAGHFSFADAPVIFRNILISYFDIGKK